MLRSLLPGRGSAALVLVVALTWPSALGAAIIVKAPDPNNPPTAPSPNPAWVGGPKVVAGLNAVVQQGPNSYPPPTGPTWSWTVSAANVLHSLNGTAWSAANAAQIQLLQIIQTNSSSPVATLEFQTTQAGYFQITPTATATWSDGSNGSAAYNPPVSFAVIDVVFNPYFVIVGEGDNQVIQATVTPASFAGSVSFTTVTPSGGASAVRIVSQQTNSSGVAITVTAVDPRDPNDDTPYQPPDTFLLAQAPGVQLLPPQPIPPPPRAAQVAPVVLFVRNPNTIPGPGFGVLASDFVAVRTDLEGQAQMAPGAGIPANQVVINFFRWTIGGNTIKTYTHQIDNRNVFNDVAMPAMPIQATNISFIWTRPGNHQVQLSANVTVQGVARVFNKPPLVFNVRRLTDESRQVYCGDRDNPGQVVRRCPNGAPNGHYEVCNNHSAWHSSLPMQHFPAPGPAAAPAIPTGSFTAPNGARVWGDRSDIVLGNNNVPLPGFGPNYSGESFLNWHNNYIKSWHKWWTFFQVPVPAGAGGFNFPVVPPSYQANPGAPLAGGAAEERAMVSPWFGFVRLGEFRSLNQLGKDMNHPPGLGWHSLGHSRIGGEMIQVPNAPHHRDEAFWRWHWIVESVAANWAPDVAQPRAFLGANGTSVEIAFNLPVSSSLFVGAGPVNPNRLVQGDVTVTNRANGRNIPVVGFQAIANPNNGGRVDLRRFRFTVNPAPAANTPVRINLAGSATFAGNAWNANW